MHVIICEDTETCLVKCAEELAAKNYSIQILQKGSKSLQELLEENRIAEGCVVIWSVFSEQWAQECRKMMNELRLYRADIRFIVCIAALRHLDTMFATEPDYMFSVPVNIKGVCEAVENCSRSLSVEDRDYITVQRKGHINCLNVNTISYVESRGRCLEIVLQQGDKLTVYMQLKEIQNRLPAFFVRCHQSYCVNMYQVKEYDCGKLLMHDDRVIPISRRYRQRTREIFEKISLNLAL